MSCPCASTDFATGLEDGTQLRRYGSTKFFDVFYDTIQSCFKINRTPDRSSEQIEFQYNTSFVEIRRKGKTPIIATYPMFSYDENGYGCFVWDSAFLEADEGFYTADLFINCCYYMSLNFRLRPSQVVVTDDYRIDNNSATSICGNTIGAPQCADDVVNDDCGGTTPSFSPSPDVDVETQEPVAEEVQYDNGEGCTNCGLQPIGSDAIGQQ